MPVTITLTADVTAPLARFIQKGDESIDFTPAADVKPADVVVAGGILAVAKHAITAATLGGVALEGVFDVAKSGSTGPVFAIGDPVYFDLTNGLAVNGQPAARTALVVFLGTAIVAAATGDTIVRTLKADSDLPPCMVDKVWEAVTLAGGSKTLDREDAGKVLNVTAGHATNVITLPATAVGDDFVVRCGADGQRVALSPNASDKMLGADLTGTDNKDLILTAATAKAGDYISIKGDGADGYVINGIRGIWAAEG